MTTDLEDRLHAYRPTLDEAIAGAGTMPVGRRHRRLVPAAAAATLLIGTAGLVTLAQRDGPTGRGTSPTSIVLPDAPTATWPLLLLDHPDYTPVEYQGYASEDYQSARASIVTYLSVRADGTVSEVEVQSIRPGGTGLDVATPPELSMPEPEQTTVRGHPAAVGREDGYITLNWMEFESTSVLMTVPTTDVAEAVTLAERLVPGDDERLLGLIEAIVTTDLPPVLQEWREWRSAQTRRPPISFGLAVG